MTTNNRIEYFDPTPEQAAQMDHLVDTGVDDYATAREKVGVTPVKYGGSIATAHAVSKAALTASDGAEHAEILNELGWPNDMTDHAGSDYVK